jgi:hypothetical protein
MKHNKYSRSSLIYFILPLLVYEIAFAGFVIYYSQQNSSWFRLTYVFICAAFIVAFIKILSCYRKWENAYATDRRTYIISLLAYFTNFIVYLFSLFIQAEQWNSLRPPPTIIFVLLAIPPLLEFIIFLVAGSPEK